jgi:hypothetical protein
MVKTHKHESIAHGEMEICHSGTYKLTGLLSPAIATTVGAKKKAPTEVEVKVRRTRERWGKGDVVVIL